MTNFKIVSVGWECGEWLEQTLASVEQQSHDQWQIWITYDPSEDDGAQRIRDWCDVRQGSGDDRWHYTINHGQDRRFAVRNQWEAIQNLAPEDDDVVVWLDLDGDMLAHSQVLTHLSAYYAELDAPQLTYGSYKAVPDMGTSPIAEPFPPGVVEARAYRNQMQTGICCFNHLRTMKGRVVKAIPADQFRFREGPTAGEWYTIGTDYIFMTPAFELVDGRFKFISETLLLYNHDNPRADYLVSSIDSFACVQDCLHRPPLARLEW